MSNFIKHFSMGFNKATVSTIKGYVRIYGQFQLFYVIFYLLMNKCKKELWTAVIVVFQEYKDSLYINYNCLMLFLRVLSSFHISCGRSSPTSSLKYFSMASAWKHLFNYYNSTIIHADYFRYDTVNYCLKK